MVFLSIGRTVSCAGRVSWPAVSLTKPPARMFLRNNHDRRLSPMDLDYAASLLRIAYEKTTKVILS